MKDDLRLLGYSKNSINNPYNYYITPDIAVIKLLEREKFKGLGWECACGNGAISKLFEKEYPNFISSDIREGEDIYGIGGIDFLICNPLFDKVNFIVTNPPSNLMLEFAQHAIELADKVALLGRIQFLEGKKRYKFFMEYPPIRVHVFSNRIICRNPFDTDLNSGIMCFAWYIWQKNFKGFTTLDWINTDE